ncbi:MAG: pectate lyase [Acidobacteria bacterium]|nr:pectate lyase [Acidobacteriota bacterium]
MRLAALAAIVLAATCLASPAGLASSVSPAGARAAQPPAGPQPRDGATDVSLTNAQLRWPAVPGAVSYDVYLGTSMPPHFGGNQPGTSFDAGALETATTYYWRIDAVTAAGRTPGATWSFMTGGTVRIMLVGDSTVTDEVGWGRGFLARVTSHTTVVNAAKNGRSSKSFVEEGLWREALTHPADYILIQFGHNDMPGKGPDRETDAAKTYRDYMARYIDDARAAGAQPVIVTSLTRRYFTETGTIASDLGPYVDAAKAVASAKGAPMIDLHALSIALLNRVGPAAGDAFGIVKADGTLDRTHLSARGSEVFGAMVADELRRIRPELGPYIRPPIGQAMPLRRDPAAPGASVGWTRVLDQPDAWYAGDAAVAVADNVLVFQRVSGGWSKNTDMARRLEPFELAQVHASKSDADSTIDNGATTTQLRFLARVYAAARLDRFRSAFLAGVDFLFAAQYPNGGWPQFFPLRKDYSRLITFNDDAMTNVLELLRDMHEARPPLAFVDHERRAWAKTAYERGVAVILAAQIRVNGRLTAWCAQVDEVTLEPRKARAYEHPSISGKESIGIVRFLMSIPHPSPEIVSAVESAVSWFKEVQLSGIRVEDRRDPSLPGGIDRVVVEDPAAPPLWARFYEIGTNRPIYSGRDSVVRYSLAEIELERRVNYSWLGPYATELLARDYASWKASR